MSWMRTRTAGTERMQFCSRRAGYYVAHADKGKKDGQRSSPSYSAHADKPLARGRVCNPPHTVLCHAFLPRVVGATLARGRVCNPPRTVLCHMFCSCGFLSCVVGANLVFVPRAIVPCGFVVRCRGEPCVRPSCDCPVRLCPAFCGGGTVGQVQKT